LQEHVRASDWVARYGGESSDRAAETNVANAAVAAEHLRAKVAATPFPDVAGGLAVTASFGVAGWQSNVPQGSTFDALVARCDEACTRARRRPQLRHRPAVGLAFEEFHASAANRRVCRGWIDRPDRHRLCWSWCSSIRTTTATTSRSIVKEKTGRELTLSGDLKLSVFPWIALEAGPATLGDAPGSGRSRSSRSSKPRSACV
jgi:hypothetical protein